jgi:Ca2+-binding RTX toxin-like protein
MNFKFVSDLANLASDAYGENGFRIADYIPENSQFVGSLPGTSGWHYLDPSKLVGLDFSGPGRDIDEQVFFVFRNNKAYIAYQDADPITGAQGKLAIIFRGADPDWSGVLDVPDYLNISLGTLGASLAGFAPIVNAATIYADQNAMTIWAAGHSLGGALAELLVSKNNAFSGGLGLGSPGMAPIDRPFANPQSEFIHIAHNTDIVGNIFPSGHVGTNIEIEDHTFGTSIGGNSHGISGYLNEFQVLAESSAFVSAGTQDLSKIYFANYNVGQNYSGEVPAGDIAFVGTGNADTINGGHHTDSLRIEGDFGNDHIIGGTASDVLSGGYGADIIIGGGGSDQLIGGKGNDRLIGGSGNDQYSIGLYQGSDIISDQGNGIDTIELSTGSVFSTFNYDWFSRDGNDLLIKAFDSTGTLAIDVRILNAGNSANSIEKIDLLLSDGSHVTNSWNLSTIWADLSEGVTPQSSSPNMSFSLISQLTDLSVQAYPLRTFTGTFSDGLPAGWTYLSHADLGNFSIPAYSALRGQSYGYDNNGYYTFKLDEVLNPLATVDMQVYAAVKDGQVAIVFRGTQESVDLITDSLIPLGILHTALDGLSEFIDAVKFYAISNNFILLAAGHSLGGATAELLVATDATFSGGLGLASPGFDNPLTVHSMRVPNFVHVTHDTDLIGHTILSSVHIGSELLLADNTWGVDYRPGGATHSSLNYAPELTFLAASDGFKDVDPTQVGRVFQVNHFTAFSGFVPDTDYAVVGSNTDDFISGRLRSDFLRIDGGAGNDRIIGGSAGDVLAGGAGSDRVSGNAGDDTLYGGTGIDFLDGGTGNDTLIGGSGNDRYSIGVYQGADVIRDEGNGFDTIALSTGLVFSSFSYDWFSKDGNDLLIKAYDSDGNLAIDVRVVGAGTITNSIERIELLAGDGTQVTNTWDLSALWAGLEQGSPPPTPAPTPIIPSAGSNIIYLTSGDDNITTDSGDHGVVSYGNGNDYVQAGSGFDQLFVLYDYTADPVYSGLDGYGNYFVSNNSNTLRTTGFEVVTIVGGTGNDNLNGTGRADALYGGDGNDSLNGNGGNDVLISGGGDDSISTTSSGIFYVDGGTGTDTWYGDLSSRTVSINFVMSRASTSSGYTLSDGSHVQNIERLWLSTGSGDDTLFVGTELTGRNY